ncbi:hypothetical protein C483_00820 [Natrialba hulunbeirensis JCM 10989]|uniref:Uncharacterized protein n=1 Tax=Natrialba hulunbeirensis JCM 10989 TaxID=1227493 RepID=M0AD35_9EURY|nr:hypothetical protein [Natrialba hulunbeirensis]ELY95777.1 hypothetical protein C483_00820 [Natrialba hulunbeirensis JCM 10989]
MPNPQLEREADAAAEQALSSDEPLVVNRMGSDVHIQRSAKDGGTMAYQGLDSLTDEVAEIRTELQETKSDVSNLQNEVHSGLGETAMGVAGAGVTAGAIALGRAASEPTLQETLSESGANPELAAPAIAAAALTLGVGAASEGVTNTFGKLRNRLFSADDDASGKRDDDEREEDDSGLLNW